jgi:3-oxoacyl-[acyl-carrier-protein] synthase-3
MNELSEKKRAPGRRTGGIRMQKVKIVGTGIYLPKQVVTAEQLDQKMGLRDGWVAKKSGVLSRRYVSDADSISKMGAAAIESALADAGLGLNDLDCIICASASFDQPLPSSASLIKAELAFRDRPIPAYDVDSTCLSFVVALDIVAHLIAAGKYKTVAIVSSEIASRGINFDQPESAALFGDGAAAVIVTATPDGETSGMLMSNLETYEEGAHLTEIRGGGANLHATAYTKQNEKEYLFDMDGRSVFRLSARHIHDFMDRLFQNKFTLADIDLVVPHQASSLGMEHMQKKLEISDEKFMNVIAHYGNMIAASIPVALHEAIQQGRMKRGDKVLLIGTSAGLSIGGIVIEY